MATLILTTVGTIVGGPIGGAIGALAGQTLDRALLRPGPREGPRLRELALQTSSYGSEIAHLFGTMRVAGSVIWATDLIETREREGGGKGAPGTIRYSYAASFAVLLSARPIRGVGRIWADGKLLRGAAGGFTVRTGFRLHLGGENQVPDPLIASAVGPDRAPAMRGQAYAVFEGMALADFGNRLPSLTFEVIADEVPVDPGRIAAAMSDGAVAAAEPMAPRFEGFSAHGGSRRALIETMAQASGAWFASDGAAISMRSGPGAAAVVADAGWGGGRGVRSIAPADQAPRQVTVSHYDAARDYQAGLQRAARPGAGLREQHVELPAVVSAGAAKQVAAAMLTRADAERRRRRVACGWAGLGIAPGARVQVEGDETLWRVTGWSLEAMAVELDLAPVATATASAAADPGTVVGAPDTPHGRTLIVAAELPPIGEPLPMQPQLVVVAGGTEPGWRGATLMMRTDPGAGWTVAASLRPGGVVGLVAVPPGTGLAAIEDRAGSLVVELGHDGMALAGADRAGMDGGANLALVGGELLQFGVAEPLGAGRWRLSRLWRGRRGTEAAIGGHVAGEPFALLDPENTAVVPIAQPIGSMLELAATSVGDGDALVPVPVAITGASVAPPSPVHLRAATGDGTTTLSWVRRSRAGWHWIDRVDVPLAEERERYRVEVDPGSPGAAAIECDVPTLSLESDASRVGVMQIGTHSASLTRTIMVEN
jgi:hypothetical protein